jgi:hypothetical protein
LKSDGAVLTGPENVAKVLAVNACATAIQIKWPPGRLRTPGEPCGASVALGDFCTQRKHGAIGRRLN